MERKKIIQMCEEYRSKHDIVVPFEESYELVYMAKGHIRESNRIKADLIGNVKKYKGDSFWITLNSKIPESFKIIAIATLIGCIYMYSDYDKTESKTSGRSLKLTDEMLADGHIFAKELLLPDYVFINTIMDMLDGDKIDLADVAKYFNLPVQFVKERAIDLQLIQADDKNIKWEYI